MSMPQGNNNNKKNQFTVVNNKSRALMHLQQERAHIWSISA